jgi:Ca2+-binding RTX toxin-like protein
VTNLGAGPAESVVLTATPSTRTPYRGSVCTSPLGAGTPLPQIGFLGCRFRTNHLTGSLGTLRPGASATVRLNIAAAADRSMATRVTVTSRATDAQAANNAAAFTNAVRVRRGRCVNTLVGTASADVLRGTTSGDRLSGGRGRDTISGRAGADCLNGGRGRDTISGGAGNDVIDARDGEVDTVSCGPGRDTVRADRRDRVRGCERRRR